MLLLLEWYMLHFIYLLETCLYTTMTSVVIGRIFLGTAGNVLLILCDKGFEEAVVLVCNVSLSL